MSREAEGGGVEGRAGERSSSRPDGPSSPVRGAVEVSPGELSAGSRPESNSGAGPNPVPPPMPAAPGSEKNAERSSDPGDSGGAKLGAGVDPSGAETRQGPPSKPDAGAKKILYSSTVEIGGVAAPLVVTREEREVEDDVEEVVLAQLSLGGRVYAFRQRGFEEHVICEPPKLVEAPPGITILSTGWCDPWSCGGGCLRTQQVLYIPHEAPTKGRWYELSCNENLSTYPDAEVNDACDCLDVFAKEATIMLERTSSKPCVEEEDLGRIRRATVRRSRVVMSPTGAELEPGPIEPYRRDLWACEEQP